MDDEEEEEDDDGALEKEILPACLFACFQLRLLEIRSDMNHKTLSPEQACHGLMAVGLDSHYLLC
ncbi:hypothetical protein SLEP1_g30833 [Rubroshorea leprosula]|uniref:Uncharacterized protein n=1 Tax=Rubroshorea leprosula TaxID=152421 RepID=A0AAV5K9E3_9ROSI|nr:hypothetical protein SLEP1_g30833 [Rubroshorea leprosula]